MVRKNYPFNKRDDKKMTNLISKIFVYSISNPIFAKQRMCLSIKN